MILSPVGCTNIPAVNGRDGQMMRKIVSITFFIISIVLLAAVNMIPYKQTFAGSTIYVSSDAVFISLILLVLDFLTASSGLFISKSRPLKVGNAVIMIISGFCLYERYIDSITYIGR